MHRALALVCAALLCAAACPRAAVAQNVVITELMSPNVSLPEGAPKAHGWVVELHNAGDSAVSLKVPGCGCGCTQI